MPWQAAKSSKNEKGASRSSTLHPRGDSDITGCRGFQRQFCCCCMTSWGEMSRLKLLLFLLATSSMKHVLPVPFWNTAINLRCSWECLPASPSSGPFLHLQLVHAWWLWFTSLSLAPRPAVRLALGVPCWNNPVFTVAGTPRSSTPSRATPKTKQHLQSPSALRGNRSLGTRTHPVAMRNDGSQQTHMKPVT